MKVKDIQINLNHIHITAYNHINEYRDYIKNGLHHRDGDNFARHWLDTGFKLYYYKNNYHRINGYAQDNSDLHYEQYGGDTYCKSYIYGNEQDYNREITDKLIHLKIIDI